MPHWHGDILDLPAGWHAAELADAGLEVAALRALPALHEPQLEPRARSASETCLRHGVDPLIDRGGSSHRQERPRAALGCLGASAPA